MKSTSKKILVVDVGGSHLKIHAPHTGAVVKIDSGPTMTAAKMVAAVRAATQGWHYDVVSIGFPGPVKNNRPVLEPHNLGGGWTKYNFQKAFGLPLKMLNDAAMQALGGHDVGRTLFLGLGTGLGSALVVDKVVFPLELAHLPYRKNRTYEEYLGLAGLKRLGQKKWQHHVFEVAELLKKALIADYIVLGGGNARMLKKLPPDSELGKNSNAIRGGYRMWRTP